MIQTIPMSREAEQKLTGVKVMGAVLQLEPVPDKLRALSFEEEWKSLHERWRGKSKGEVAEDAHIAAYRQFYRQIGFNPNQTPPSVQNLIQRFLIKEALTRIPTVHPIVDAVNVAAVKGRIPLGIFDAACVKGPIRLAFTSGGEPFQPLGSGQMEALAEGVLVLADDEKVLSQFSYRDGEAQKITGETRHVWLLGCQVSEVEEAAVRAALDEAIAQLRRGYEIFMEEGVGNNGAR
ncbi:B3/B4 domain-containing protein [Xylanibacillus composti]|uniref:B3/B4 tRNA-binding domain-containing protein n=1 Tax=Xylanibacillus composti TaxID=1572762 RepID=A0A8J4M1N9_9BACL|nr:phenylalanine--tRNA ligase beta subunit-related protein [Xylanibacillus composti]GIQ68047.1 hypothetical protein XYCOK13_08710 [Xylanibacillus composti]